LTPSISAYYSVFLTLVCVFMFVCCTVMMRLLIGGSWGRSALWAAITALVYFSFYNDLAPTIYWIAGATENALGVVLMSLAIWPVMREFAEETKVMRIQNVGVFVCLLIAPGCHELAGLIVCAFFALMLVWAYFFRKQRIPKVLVYAFIFAIVGTAINVFSPGNSGRGGIAFREPSVVEIINASTIIVLRTLRNMMSPQMLLGIVLASIVIQKYPDITKRMLLYREQAFAIVVAMFLALLGVLIVYSIKLGGHPSARTINFFCSSMFMVILPALLIIITGYIDSEEIKAPRWVESMLYLLVGLTVILAPNIDKGFFSYKKGLGPWIKDQESRHALLLKHAELGSKDVLIKPGPVAPHLLFTEWELGENPKCWQNKDQARYYKVRSIRMSPVE
jgi:hypothetical protein